MKISCLILVLITSAYAFAGTSELPTPAPGNEIEARNLKTFELWHHEVWGKARLELVSELVTSNYTRHEGGNTRVVTSEEYALEIEENLGRGVRFTVHQLTIDNDLLWTRWSSNATILGFDVAFQGIQIYRFEDGRLTETWMVVDIGDRWPD